jgi:hypothetical protein
LTARRGEPGYQHPGGRGERGRRGALPEPGQPHPRGITGEHKRRGRGGEGEQPAEQDRARTDPVGQRTEHWFEGHFGAVVDR